MSDYFSTVPTINNNQWSPYTPLIAGDVSVNYMELNTDPSRLGRLFVNKYRGNNGFEPPVIQNCINFWAPIFATFF